LRNIVDGLDIFKKIVYNTFYEEEIKIMVTKNELPSCPVATTVQLIGNKWKLLIIRNLLQGTQRFGELQKTITGISQKVLTDNLRAMEADGLVVRKIYAEVPPKVEYSLSELGYSMKPIIDAMAIWGTNYQNSFKTSND
jgi:DNA-binding HxlR family transcriptional regulator